MDTEVNCASAGAATMASASIPPVPNPAIRLIAASRWVIPPTIQQPLCQSGPEGREARCQGRFRGTGSFRRSSGLSPWRDNSGAGKGHRVTQDGEAGPVAQHRRSGWVEAVPRPRAPPSRNGNPSPCGEPEEEVHQDTQDHRGEDHHPPGRPVRRIRDGLGWRLPRVEVRVQARVRAVRPRGAHRSTHCAGSWTSLRTVAGNRSRRGRRAGKGVIVAADLVRDGSRDLPAGTKGGRLEYVRRQVGPRILPPGGRFRTRHSPDVPETVRQKLVPQDGARQPPG